MHFNIFCKKQQLTCQSILISYDSNKSEKIFVYRKSIDEEKLKRQLLLNFLKIKKI